MISSCFSKVRKFPGKFITNAKLQIIILIFRVYCFNDILLQLSFSSITYTPLSLRIFVCNAVLKLVGFEESRFSPFNEWGLSIELIIILPKERILVIVYLIWHLCVELFSYISLNPFFIIVLWGLNLICVYILATSLQFVVQNVLDWRGLVYNERNFDLTREGWIRIDESSIVTEEEYRSDKRA
jgi:hypothetical protein